METRIEVIVPELGLPTSQSISVSCWLVDVGDQVIEGDRLVELLADEITFDVASPATGRLSQRCVEVDEPVTTGVVLARLIPSQ